MTVSQLLTNTTTSTTKIKYKIIEHLSLKTDANTDATKSRFFTRLGFVVKLTNLSNANTFKNRNSFTNFYRRPRCVASVTDTIRCIDLPNLF